MVLVDGPAELSARAAKRLHVDAPLLGIVHPAAPSVVFALVDGQALQRLARHAVEEVVLVVGLLDNRELLLDLLLDNLLLVKLAELLLKVEVFGGHRDGHTLRRAVHRAAARAPVGQRHRRAAPAHASTAASAGVCCRGVHACGLGVRAWAGDGRRSRCFRLALRGSALCRRRGGGRRRGGLREGDRVGTGPGRGPCRLPRGWGRSGGAGRRRRLLLALWARGRAGGAVGWRRRRRDGHRRASRLRIRVGLRLGRGWRGGPWCPGRERRRDGRAPRLLLRPHWPVVCSVNPLRRSPRALRRRRWRRCCWSLRLSVGLVKGPLRRRSFRGGRHSLRGLWLPVVPLGYNREVLDVRAAENNVVVQLCARGDLRAIRTSSLGAKGPHSLESYCALVHIYGVQYPFISYVALRNEADCTTDVGEASSCFSTSSRHFFRQLSRAVRKIFVSSKLDVAMRCNNHSSAKLEKFQLSP
mmetsp:Transcript_14406/g.34115  ORF Transcript_14406/g.34115 Transcript_14406/m.34115 type:complete len:470 (-) Transcript_14406:12-1421(-)